MSTPQFLIWSIEHGAWWAPNSIGYVHRRSQAGKYSESEAREIVAGANIARKDNEPPNEAMIPVEAEDVASAGCIAVHTQGNESAACI